MPKLLATAIVLAVSLGAVIARGAEPAKVVAKAKAAAVLEQQTAVDFEQAKLYQLLDFLREKQGLKVLVDKSALESAGVATDSLINIKARYLPLKSALRMALEPLELGYLLRDDVLVVTTRERAEGNVYPKVYPVADLLQQGSVPGSPDAYDHEALVELVSSVVAVTSWEDAGGPGSLASFETSLVVSQTAAVHDEIAQLLAELRRAKAARPGAKPGPLRPAGPWEKTFSLKFDKLSLTEALSRISEAAGVDTFIDREGIGEHVLLTPGVGSGKVPEDDELLSADLKKTRLREALREILFAHDLAHIEKHGAVLVTSLERAEESCRLQIYDVKALLRDRDGRAETVADLDYDAVVMLLMSAVAPSSWDDAGGPATLCAFDGFLVVLQTDAAHLQIASLFEQLRQIKFPAAAGAPAPPDTELRKVLASTTACDFEDIKLVDVLDALAEKHDLEISLDKPALQRVGVSPEALVNLKLGELKLQTALQFILDPLDLRYYLQNGVLIVSIPEVAERHPCPRVYDLSDFAAVAKKPKLAAFEVSQLIQKTIEPSAWVDAGGSGTVVIFENTLVVSNSHVIHCQIEDLLAEFRRLRPKPQGK